MISNVSYDTDVTDKQKRGVVLSTLERLNAGSDLRMKKSAARMVATTLAGVTFIMLYLPTQLAIIYWVPHSASWKLTLSRAIMWLGVVAAAVVWVSAYRGLKSIMQANGRSQ